MDSRTRLLTAWSSREPDRVPIELQISPEARQWPEAQRIVDFIDSDADNFGGAPGADWGFFGLQTSYHEDVLEDVPGEFKRVKRVHETPAGEFYAITQHFHDEMIADYHWQRRFIATLEEMERLADAPRDVCPIFKDRHDAAVARIGDRAVPLVGVSHPLGSLVRSANLEEVYSWFGSEPALMHRFLQATNRQVADTVQLMADAGIGPHYSVCAHEMLIPPWLGHRMFDEFVFPYDKAVNDVIHQHGGRVRAHCHGNCMDFLVKMSAMGIDAIEPLEPVPFGDVDLAEAKRRVGDRMLLSGNVPSQSFLSMSREDVREWIRGALRDGAPGGGFTLRTTGGHAATNSVKNRDQMLKIFGNIEAYIDAALEFGQYPL